VTALDRYVEEERKTEFWLVRPDFCPLPIVLAHQARLEIIPDGRIVLAFLNSIFYWDLSATYSGNYNVSSWQD